MKLLNMMTAVAATALFVANPAGLTAHAQNQAATESTVTAKDAAAGDIRAVPETPALSVQGLNPQMTAASMIGQSIYSSGNTLVGKVHDIIMDENGKATTIVVSDSQIPGTTWDYTSFDYNSITTQDVNGSVVMKLPDESLKQARAFYYGEDNQPATSGFSAAQLLDAELVNPNNESVAQIDNISLENGQAKDLIIAFDQVLGFGGKKAAMDFQSAKIIRGDEGVNFQLSTAQESALNNFKAVSEQ